MNNYLDILMQNKTLLSTSSEDPDIMYQKKMSKKILKRSKNSHQMNKQSNIKGGHNNSNNVPHDDMLLNPNILFGGDIKLKAIPSGGFPPIVKCKKSDKLIEEDKMRGFSTNNTAVSIKEIMKERRDEKPFISF